MFQQPILAVLLVAIGVTLALAVLFHPNSTPDSTEVLGIARDIVIGAIGAFAGHVTSAKDPR